MMATLRNLVIGLIRQAGYPKIAATHPQDQTDPQLLLRILGLPQPPKTAPCTAQTTLRVALMSDANLNLNRTSPVRVANARLGTF
jgi:hypothetical protein